MKKKIIILSLAVVCTLSACGITKQESSTEDNTKQENTNITDTMNDETMQQSEEKENTQQIEIHIDETEFPQEYASILNMYVNALREKWDGNTLMKNGLNLLTLDLYGDNSLSLIGYNMIDFDGNGMKELVIGTTDQVADEFYQKIIFDVYTHGDDGACTQILSSSARNRYYYAGDNLFVDLGSSGANDNTNATLVYEGKGLTDTNTITDPSDYIQVELFPMSNWNKNEEEQTIETKSDAKKELTSILDKINNDVTTGTAGCKMTTVSITSELLNWGVGTELSNDQIRSTVLDWLINKGNDEAVAFSEKMSLVDETYHELLGENAKELLDSAGCENAAYPWSDEPIETIETIMNAVGLRG